MKNLLCIAFILTLLTFGCSNEDGNLSLKTTDTNSAFKFEAKYPESKTAGLEKYVDSILKKELPLGRNIDLFVNLNGNDKFNLKAKMGWLEINFDKKNTSLDSYMEVKKLASDIGKKLAEK
ncbi:hypothetical protein [Pedobacter mucosus]|uniref:hypothetical protein n=1 Tax=Pedobacter mucosus TaxID=2895286 RepID=UPI001EE3B616|nr:hypothetical protein [Pedobacter mucosus]UKT63061.1 hypothetical protein LOK61_14945 [Pedobacter mucosus]